MKTTEVDYTPIQLKLPVDMERIIEINDSVQGYVELDRRGDEYNITSVCGTQAPPGAEAHTVYF